MRVCHHVVTWCGGSRSCAGLPSRGRGRRAGCGLLLQAGHACKHGVVGADERR